MKTVESQKLQIEQAKFANAEAPNVVAVWSSEIEEQQATVDEEIAQLTKRQNELILGSTLEAKKCEEELLPGKSFLFFPAIDPIHKASVLVLLSLRPDTLPNFSSVAFKLGLHLQSHTLLQ